MFVTVEHFQSVLMDLVLLAFWLGFLGAIAALIAIDVCKALAKIALTAFAKTKQGKAIKVRIEARERRQLIKFIGRNPFILTKWETRTNEDKKRLQQIRLEVANGCGTGH